MVVIGCAAGRGGGVGVAHVIWYEVSSKWDFRLPQAQILFFSFMGGER